MGSQVGGSWVPELTPSIHTLSFTAAAHQGQPPASQVCAPALHTWTAVGSARHMVSEGQGRAGLG